MNKPLKYERPIVRKLSMVTQSSTGGKLGRGLFPFQLHKQTALRRSLVQDVSDTSSAALITQSDADDSQPSQSQDRS